MPARFRQHLLIALLAFAAAQGWNRWNLAAMRASPEAVARVRPGGSVITADDASYLQEVEKLLGHRPDLEQGPASRKPILRPPGYGWWYLLPRLLLAPESAIAALVLLQALLFAFSVALLHEALCAQGIAPRIRWPLVVLMAVMPTFQGFLFHTITEGITPALSLIVLCCAVLAGARGKDWLVAGCMAWSLLMVTRPVLAWVGLALLPPLWGRSRSVLRAAGLVALCAAPTAGWWLNNCVRTGHVVSLHPVYKLDDPGIIRPTHSAFWELAKSWGARGDAFHGVMESAFHAALACDTGSVHAEAFLALAPAGSHTGQQRTELRHAFHDWQRFTCSDLAPALDSPEGTIPFTTPLEHSIIARVSAITDEWRSAHPLHHHVIVPLRVLKQLAAHSNLNLWVFQHTWRGHPAVEAMRWFSAILHAALLAAAALAFLFRVPLPVRLISAGCAAYLLYLAYVQRGVEERYTLPVLFVGVACAAFMVGRLRGRARNHSA